MSELLDAATVPAKLWEIADRYKYTPAVLIHSIAAESPDAAAFRQTLEDLMARSLLPPALRTWKAAIIGLMGYQAAGIASPYTRATTIGNLSALAAAAGIENEAFPILCSEAARLLPAQPG